MIHFTSVAVPRVCAIAGGLLCAAFAAGVEPPTAPPPRLIPMAELVKQLGSNNAREYEAAAAKLSSMGLDPSPELLALTKSKDPELRVRAEKTAQAMRWNVAAKRLPRGQKFIEQGRVDLFVAATAVWDLKPDDPRLWEPAVDFGRRLIEKGDLKDGRNPHNCPSSFRDFATYERHLLPRFTRTDEKYTRESLSLRNEAIQAAGVAFPGGICGSIIVSRGSIDTQNGISTSVILANGDVTAVTGLFSVVIVCDGDVNLTDRYISRSLIVARGAIAASEGVIGSLLLAGGKIKLGKKITEHSYNYNVVRENTSDMLGIKFFELSTFGIEAKVIDKSVQLTAITSDKFFFRAGLFEAGVKIGDIFTEVNGKKPDSPESLRRLLRDALAIGDATVKLKRGDETLTVKVVLPE